MKSIDEIDEFKEEDGAIQDEPGESNTRDTINFDCHRPEESR